MADKPSNAEYRRAADSRTAPEELARLAAVHPVLRPTIAANPASYPALREWIATHKATPVESASLVAATPVAAPGILATLRTSGAPLALAFVIMLGLSGIAAGWAAGAQAAEDSSSDVADDPVDDGSGTVDDGSTDGGPVVDVPGTTDAPATSGALPTTCDQLFSPGMRATLEARGLILQTDPPAFQAAPLNVPLATRSQKYPHLNCWWAPAGGGSGGILTTVAQVDDTQARDIENRLSGLYSPLAELGGIRYFYEHKKPAYGESHIVLGDLWFATRWIRYGPKGYTADMVDTYLG